MKAITEEEARDKWCPFANRLIELTTGKWKVCKRDENDEPLCFCVTTDCMAWQQWEADPSRGWCGLVK